MSNPYEDLGVDKNADKATIKKVYRKKAQSEHPDRGGDPEKFDKITKAYKLLTDNSRRARFDQTGEDGQEDRKLIILQRLARLFVNCIENFDVDHTDIVESMRLNLVNGQLTNRQSIGLNENAIKKYERVKKRLRKKTPGQNLLIEFVDGQIGGLRQGIERATDEIAKQQEMIDALKNYAYDASPDGGLQARFGHNPVLLGMVRRMQG
jgi:curved DNA-binding protein CbpA